MKTITVDPSRDSSLYYEDHPILIGDTKYGGRAFVETYLNNNRESALHLEWMKRLAGQHHEITVVDVGANVGLFSRQALIALPNIAQIFSYEPDKENFDAMTANLAPWWSGRLTLKNCALGIRHGNARLYRDAINGGNNSLLPAAMGENEFDSVQISITRASVQSMEWFNAGRPILYKSDTQGYDELIATSINPRVWDKIFAAVFEIWRIEKPDFDIITFADILESFPNLMLLNSQRVLTVSDALTYSAGKDGHWDDLAIWK